LKPASEHAHARLLPILSSSWTVLLPSDTREKPITSITAVLLPFVTYLLTFPRSNRRTTHLSYRSARFVKHPSHVNVTNLFNVTCNLCSSLQLQIHHFHIMKPMYKHKKNIKYLELNDLWEKSLPNHNRLSEMLYVNFHFFTDEYSG
jgi:hypothetical protein